MSTVLIGNTIQAGSGGADMAESGGRNPAFTRRAEPASGLAGVGANPPERTLAAVTRALA